MTLVDVLDFAGDGSRGLLLTTARAGKIDTYMVHGRSGKVTHLWLDENNFGGHTRVGKLLPDVAGLQIAVTASGQTPPAPHGGDVRLVAYYVARMQDPGADDLVERLAELARLLDRELMDLEVV